MKISPSQHISRTLDFISESARAQTVPLYTKMLDSVEQLTVIVLVPKGLIYIYNAPNAEITAYEILKLLGQR